MHKKILVFLLLFYSTVFCSTVVYSQPKLFSSDWPVWNLTEGMHKEGLLGDFNYKLKKYETTLKWFKAGNLEVTFMTLYDFISIQPTKTPTVILGITDYSNGGDKIILRKSIKTPKDLKGKKILLATNTISLWLLHNYLVENGMSLNDVIIENQSVNVAPLQFKEDSNFSAVVGWNPNIDNALGEDAYIASTSADFPRAIYDLIVAKKNFVDSNPEKIETFLSNYYEGIKRDSVIDKTAASLSVSGNEYRLWLSDARIFTSRSEADNERQHILKNAHKIKEFLTIAPKSIHNETVLKKFRERTIDLEKVIMFGK